jgi:peroxiredoxin
MEELKAGDKAPPFEASDQDGLFNVLNYAAGAKPLRRN